jgi:glucose/arabinose dehydrogenase
MSRVQRVLLSSLLAFAAGAPATGVVLAASGGEPAQAATLPSGFAEQIVFSGLDKPTKVAFAPDGRVFVAEKKGTIKVFDSLSDPSPTLFADLSTNVYNYEDEGLLGLALPPNFPSNPYVYVSYVYDAPKGGTAPVFNDRCPTPSTGCVVSGRVSRLQAAGNQATGAEQVLVNDWCTQFESHAIGNLAFGPDGALYVSGGDGSTAAYTDWGQSGSPVNPCGDPPGGVGGAMSPPSAEGGALRAQDLRTSGDPTGLSGTMIRIDPATGAAKTDNPLYGSTTDANARRIVAYGLRNPFRWTFRPGTSEVWFGDVGWRNWEEINRLVNPLASTVTNFGWPCYEGDRRQPGYDSADLALCENLYAPRRSLPDRRLQPHRPGVLPDCRRHVPGAVRRRVVLRRLCPPVHLGDAPRRQRPAQPGQHRHLRAGRGGPCRPAGRAGRRPLLRGPHRRHGPPDSVQLGQPATQCCHLGHAHLRPPTAGRELQLRRLDRPGQRRRPHLPVGLHQRRYVRRDRRDRDVHLLIGRHLHRAAQGDRCRWAERQQDGPDPRRHRRAYAGH